MRRSRERRKKTSAKIKKVLILSNFLMWSQVALSYGGASPFDFRPLISKSKQAFYSLFPPQVSEQDTSKGSVHSDKKINDDETRHLENDAEEEATQTNLDG